MDIRFENLIRLVELIDDKLSAVSTSWRDADWAAHRANLHDLELEMTEQEGARFGNSNGALTIRLAGISSSCTSSVDGLLLNWANAARRKIEANGCPGHVASRRNAKSCRRCGVHIDDLRPDDFSPVSCDPLPVLKDAAGREMREFLTEFKIDGRTFGDSVIAYDLADAERLVSDMRNSLRVVGAVVERGQI